MTIAELWSRIDRGNIDTRDAIQKELDDVRNRLGSYLTRDQFAAEKAILVMRLERAELELRLLDERHTSLAEKVAAERADMERRRANDLAQREQARLARRANFWSSMLFKVGVPVLIVLLPLLMALWSPLH
jgi:hypothetical protein